MPIRSRGIKINPPEPPHDPSHPRPLPKRERKARKPNRKAAEGIYLSPICTPSTPKFEDLTLIQFVQRYWIPKRVGGLFRRKKEL